MQNNAYAKFWGVGGGGGGGGKGGNWGGGRGGLAVTRKDDWNMQQEKKWGLLRIRFCLQQEKILVYNKYPSIK